ncbi:hypothetical protein O181_017927 [Austropuccinia psidii MF-1]|uniref:Uncharacterized protein n=1 Tax=Austropuccinia psidii MF-1 TaxID=1389203 RepID=A0A9Q3GT11_9BASI|nr:hypothetical protein [Austropuccinia psidii MF-1]
MISKVLTCSQAHKAEFPSEFHFSISYFPGCLTTLTDSLSCQEDVFPERRENFISKNKMNPQKLIKQDGVQPSIFFSVKVKAFSDVIYSIQKELWKDPQYRSNLQDLGKHKSVTDYSLHPSSPLLFFKDWVMVPNYPTIQLIIL